MDKKPTEIHTTEVKIYSALDHDSPDNDLVFYVGNPVTHVIYLSGYRANELRQRLQQPSTR